MRKRKLRILVHLLLTMVLLFFLYIFMGSPVLSPQEAYRRAEKTHLVGPATILDTVELPPMTRDAFTHMIVADDGSGIITYLWNEINSPIPRLTYREKTDDLTVLAVPVADVFSYWAHEKAVILPVILADAFPTAARAELEITLSGEYNGAYHENTYVLTADREKPGYFLFYIQLNSTQRFLAELLSV